MSTSRISAADLGWAAGMIDGEGSISLARKGGAHCYCLQLDVGNTCRAALVALRDIFGAGNVCTKKTHGNRKPGWQWYVGRAQAAKVLRQIAPYLRIKQQQAAVALEYRANLRYDGRPLTEEECWVRDVLAGIMHELNRRGKRVPAATARSVCE